MTGLGEFAQAGTVDQAIAFGDVLFIAVPYAALPQIGRDFGEALKGKIMLDARNAVAPRDGNMLADEVGQEGIGVVSQKYLHGARLVRDAGFDAVIVGQLAEAARFQRGAPGYGQAVTAAELRQKLSLTP